MLAINRLALMREFMTVSVVYRPEGYQAKHAPVAQSGMDFDAPKPKAYTYKSSFECKVGDEVVVITPNGTSKIVDVVAVKPYAELESPETIEYKWLVCKVEREGYEAMLKQEAQTVERMEQIRAVARAERTKKSLLDECADSPQALEMMEAFFAPPQQESEGEVEMPTAEQIADVDADKV